MSEEKRFRFYDVGDVRAAAKDRWESVLVALGIGQDHLTGRHTKCPGCGGRDRFRFDDKGEGKFLCSQGTGDILSGDGITLVSHAFGIPWKDAIQKIGDQICPEKVREWDGDRRAAREADPERRQWLPPVERPAMQGAMPFDLGTLRRAVRADLRADDGWFIERSPIPVASIRRPEDYLGAVFSPGERALVFTDYYSQGDILFESGRGAYRLADRPGIKAKRMDGIPTRVGHDGMWYLSQPVDGLWKANPRGKADKLGNLPLSRRSYECFTDWRHLVIESDDAPDGLWLAFLAQLAMPIVAVYRSAGRSIHALVRVENHSLPGFQLLRKRLLPMLTRYGADGGALTANRLTRLPLGERKVVTCQACGKRQTAPEVGRSSRCKCGQWVRGDDGKWVSQSLLYLNPWPEPAGLPICEGGNRSFETEWRRAS